MPVPLQQLDPRDLCLPEFVSAFDSIEFVNDDIVAIMFSKPIVERGPTSRRGDLDMLPEANFG